MDRDASSQGKEESLYLQLMATEHCMQAPIWWCLGS